MKKLSLYIFLVLMFCNVGFADDIIKFKIEGMSLGDSLLDYSSEEEIKETEVPGVYEDIFAVSLISKSSLTYDLITVTYKSKDKKYKIYGMAGIKEFPNNIEDCYKEQDKIVEKISMNLKKWGILIIDKEDNTTYKPITYEDKNGDGFSVSCYHHPNEPELNNLKVSLDIKEFKNYIKTTAITEN